MMTLRARSPPPPSPSLRSSPPTHESLNHHPRRHTHSVGHTGKFGHEFMEFEVQRDGRLRYANNSNYKNAKMIRKQGERASAYAQ